MSRDITLNLDWIVPTKGSGTHELPSDAFYIRTDAPFGMNKLVAFTFFTSAPLAFQETIKWNFTNWDVILSTCFSGVLSLSGIDRYNSTRTWLVKRTTGGFQVKLHNTIVLDYNYLSRGCSPKGGSVLFFNNDDTATVGLKIVKAPSASEGKILSFIHCF